ncbi:MAG: UDP-2-acetamido-3-amino-2,3-dideoxy-glucuronate N-acetyltransferase [Actinomycetota bacterium]|jgi:UDP-2-acetamido-3-amino-2,3-dideoxy-glucuronate N-acetyltransferase|nr:UDP-2-acetamido-3-amino-2,3-dideoxy-glucuronate N-acetyltransferase [Actinomycetota bacterium]
MFVHETAEVSEDSLVGPGTQVWHQAQVMAGVRVGAECTIGKGVFLGAGTRLGDRVKVGNYANLFGPSVEDGVFIAPLACVMEDPRPRATNPDGTRRGAGDFERLPVTIRKGASVGGGALILPGVTVGRLALVSAGAVVHRDVPDHGIVAGNPARHVGFACLCGLRLGDDLVCACSRRYVESGAGLAPAD